MLVCRLKIALITVIIPLFAREYADIPIFPAYARVIFATPHIKTISL